MDKQCHVLECFCKYQCVDNFSFKSENLFQLWYVFAVFEIFFHELSLCVKIFDARFAQVFSSKRVVIVCVVAAALKQQGDFIIL